MIDIETIGKSILQLIGAAIFAFVVMKFGAAGYFCAKEKQNKKRKE